MFLVTGNFKSGARPLRTDSQSDVPEKNMYTYRPDGKNTAGKLECENIYGVSWVHLNQQQDSKGLLYRSLQKKSSILSCQSFFIHSLIHPFHSSHPPGLSTLKPADW